MTRHPARLWLTALLLGLLFDFLFWGRPIGVNFTLFIAVCLLAGFFLLRSFGFHPAPKSLWLLVPIGFFSVMVFSRQEPVSLFLAYAFTLVPLGLLAGSYLGGRWLQYSLFDYFRKFGQLLVSLYILPPLFTAKVLNEWAKQPPQQRSSSIWPVVRGLALALPIVALFAYLLASADLIFDQQYKAFIGLLHFGSFGDFVTRLVIVACLAYGLAAIFLHVSEYSRDERLLGENQPVIRPLLGYIEACVVLGSIVLLFGIFVVIQFRYFFGGVANIGVAGMTYSQYARSGFNELIAVAFISLLLILGLSTLTRRESERQKRFYSGLNVAIVVLVIVILISAYQRLSLAIDWHGFSRLRLYPRVFLIWVGILFVAVVALEVSRRTRYFALAAVLASLGFAVTLCLTNVDAAIVQQNVLRANQGLHFNVNHLTSLSTDAVPALADEFTDSTLSQETHEGIGAALTCFLHTAIIENAAKDEWRAFNFSRWQAAQTLNGVRDQLEGYRIDARSRPVYVRTPGNVVYECAN